METQIKLSPESLDIVKLAHEKAASLRLNFVGTECLLLALLDHSTAMSEIQKNFPLDIEAARDRTIERTNEFKESANQQSPTRSAVMTPRSKKVLALSEKIADQRFNSPVAEPIHLFLGILREGDGLAASVLKEQGFKFEAALQKFITSEDKKRPFDNRLPKECKVIETQTYAGKDGLTFKVQVIGLGTNSPIRFFSTELSYMNGLWVETFQSVEALRSYMRGLCAMASMKGEVLLWPKNVHYNLG